MVDSSAEEQASDPGSGGPGYRAVLGRPGLRAVFVAHAVSMLGSVAAEIALSVLIFERTGSPFLSSLALAISFVPNVFASALLSSVVDRYPARPLLVACDLACAACLGVMLIPDMPIAAILALLFGVGVVSPLFQGARAASLAMLLGPVGFPVGRSVLRAIAMLALVVGMAVGSVVLAAVGPAWLLGADAASFVCSAALLRLGSPATPAPAAHRVTDDGQVGGGGSDPTGRGPRAVVVESLAGLRYLVTASPLRWMILLCWLAASFMAVADGLAAAYTVHVGAPASQAGIILTGGAAGTVLGEFLVARLPPHRRRPVLVPCVLLTQLPLLGFAASPPVPVAAALLALAGTGYAFNLALDPLVLAAIEPDYQGRVLTVQTSGLMTAQAIFIALGGLIAGAVAPALVIGGSGLLGAGCVGVLAHAGLRRAPRRPAPVAAPADAGV
jgi:predicted MFS family arabinose efflux permease